MGFENNLKNFMFHEKYILDYMFGLPDITVISIGSVFVIIIILLVYWGVWYNPK